MTDTTTWSIIGPIVVVVGVVIAALVVPAFVTYRAGTVNG